jgi:hypothetical protein
VIEVLADGSYHVQFVATTGDEEIKNVLSKNLVLDAEAEQNADAWCSFLERISCPRMLLVGSTLTVPIINCVTPLKVNHQIPAEAEEGDGAGAGAESRPTAPKCSKQHVMEVSDHAGPGYEGGWFCDRCTVHADVATERWFCTHCSADMCFTCGYVAIDDAVRDEVRVLGFYPNRMCAK